MTPDKSDVSTFKEEEEEEDFSNDWWLTSLLPVSSFAFLNSQNVPFIKAERMTDRVVFAQEYMEFNWDKAVFVDDHMIHLGRSRIRMWASINNEKLSDLLIREERARHFIPKRLVDIVLKPFLMPPHRKDSIFAHSAAPLYTARFTKEWYSNNDISCLWLPRCSPDFNIMENVWCALHKELGFMSHLRPTTREESVEMIKEAWKCVQSLYSDRLAELYESIPKRLRMCIRKDGELLYR